MKSKRIKIALPTIGSREEAEAAMNEVAVMTNLQRQLAASRDEQILKVNEDFEYDLAKCAQILQLKTEALRAWAEGNPDQFAKGRKSIDFLSGTLGFRTGTPKLALVSRAWNWAKVLARLKSSAPQFVRTKEEPDKEGIIAARAEGRETDESLGKLGVGVVQEESFFVEPKLTEVETRQVSREAA